MTTHHDHRIDNRLMFLFSTFALCGAFFDHSWALAFVSLACFTLACFGDLLVQIVESKLESTCKDSMIDSHRVIELEAKLATLTQKVENLQIKTTLGL